MAYGRIAAIGKLTLAKGTTSNATVLQTIDNIICFCGNIMGVTATRYSEIAHLPNNITTPSETTSFPIICTESGTTKLYDLYITRAGSIRSDFDLTNANIYLNGACVNVNSKFYSDAIGNNDESAMTYPIGRL